MASLNYHHLRYFWAVAHEGNLTRAARALRVAQSAVSVQIQTLEEELGNALFERRGKQLRLTEAGRIALDHADAIFAMGAELVGTLEAQGTGKRTVLRVGALATLSRNFQLAFLEPVLGRENVEVVVHSGNARELIRRLEAHLLDVVLVNDAPARDTGAKWVAHGIAEQRVSLVGHPERGDRTLPLSELLAKEPLVLPATESSIRIRFDALVDTLGLRPTVVAEVDDMAMLRLLARQNIGLSVVPTTVVKDELDGGELVEFQALPGIVETFFALTLMTRRFPNPLLRSLIQERPETA